MNNVIINRGQGGLGRQPLGQDYISGLIFYPSVSTFSIAGFPANGAILELGGISDAIAAGITNNHLGETTAIFHGTVGTGATGEVISIYFKEPLSNVLLCTYTQQPSDSTSTLLAASLVNAINLNSASTQYTAAVVSTNTISIKVRPGLGTYPAASEFTVYVNGTLSSSVFTTALALFNSPVASATDVYYYHISRFFTQCPNSTLYVGFFEVTGSWTGYLFPEVATMQSFATGSIRQLGVYVDQTTFATSQVTALQAQVNTQIAKNCPLSVILGADMHGIGATNLTSLASLNSEHVSVVAGQDGGAQGYTLFYAYDKSITQLGDVLGLVASSQVSDDIAWVATYTLSPDGVENAVPALATGTLAAFDFLSSLSDGTINAVDANRYIFGRQFVNDSPNGTFVNDSHCATAYTSDYAYIENNRTFDKAARQLYAAYIVQLAAPLVLNTDGTLSNSTVAFFEGLGEQALSNMAQNNPNTGRPELSGFKVFINPAQNVLQTSSLIVSVKMEPVGVAREIILNLQFAVSL